MKRYLIILVAVIGCTNSPGCFTSNGQIESQEIDVTSFSEITILDNIQLILSNGPQIITVTTGKNLIANIEFNVINNHLTIKNNNTCNWSRKYEDVIVSISTESLTFIQLLGYGKVSSSDTLKLSELTIISVDSPSSVHLLLDIDELHLSTNYLSNIKLVGLARIFKAGLYFGDGILDAKDLVVDDLFLDHQGLNTARIRPLNSLSGEMNGPGDLELYYQPVENNLIVSGGKVILKY